MTWKTVGLGFVLAAGLAGSGQGSSASEVRPRSMTASSLERADFEDGRRAAEGELVKALEELAAWCAEHRLRVERDQTWRMILRYDADHAAARKALKYKRDKNGDWVQKGYKPLNASKPDKVAEFQVERSRRVAPFIRTMLQLTDAAEPPLPIARRDSIYAELLSLDSRSKAVHARLGEAADGDSWVLIETLTARRRRAELKEAIQKALAGTKAPKPARPTEGELETGLEWTHTTVTAAGLRVLGTGARTEVETASRVAQAVPPYFEAVFGVAVTQFPDYTIYLLSKGDHEKEPFVANLPGLSQEQRDFMRQLVGGGIQNTANTAWWCGDEARRLDGATRHTFGNLFFKQWGIGVQHGWIWEGFGIYLTRELIGTRLTVYVRPSDYTLDTGDKLREILLDTKSNWMNTGYQMLQGPQPPKIAFLLGKDVNTMVTEDMLLAYVLAAYLIEGQPQAASKILGRIGAGDPPLTVFEEELGFGIPALQDRLVRWLSERR